ncbi:9898_t:CDS:2 [Acaulospora colombiana]|uniref:9898_t:CDS:1 n=1 Tax=Acaulospora colombiana TaxID=27376 RepID=A0ACA9M903_9GLOM|nr:9898_t:CDS:2 [Acaulospora colombiana]
MNGSLPNEWRGGRPDERPQRRSEEKMRAIGGDGWEREKPGCECRSGQGGSDKASIGAPFTVTLIADALLQQLIMRQFAAPLKVSASSKSDANAAASGSNLTTPGGGGSASSPLASDHAMQVEQLLNQIESKFDDMSTQILDKMNAMSSRVDTLEAAIQDLINSDVQPATPGTPSGR